MPSTFHVTVGDDVCLVCALTGRGKPVVLLHGWLCNRSFWREQIPLLEPDHRVLALDFRGHGDSSVPEHGYTLRRLADDLHAVIQHLDFGPAVVIGHSMGGMVAQQLAVTHPGDVAGLVLVATTAADPEHALISNRIAEESADQGYQATFECYFPGWFPSGSDPDLVDWIKSQMLKVPEEVALRLVLNYRDLDFRNDLPTLSQPVLVIGATQDASTPLLRSEEITHLVPGSRLVVIEGSGHFVQLEQSVAVNRAIQAFLSEHNL